MARANNKRTAGVPLITDRLESIERIVRNLVERIEVLEESIRPDVVNGVFDTCMSLVTTSKAEMNAVIHKNGVHVNERIREIEIKTAEIVSASDDALAKMIPKLDSMGDAVSQFSELEDRMTDLFSKGMKDIDSACQEFRKQRDQVDDTCEDIHKLQCQFKNLTQDNKAIGGDLKRCIAFMNKYEPIFATMETGRLHESRRSDAVTQRHQHQLDSMRGELSMLAFNVASAGVPHNGIVSGGSDMASALVAATLMRKRAVSCPPAPDQPKLAIAVPIRSPGPW